MAPERWRAQSRRKVIFVELNVNRNVLPLASGYLQAYACVESEIANGYDFVQFAECVREPRAELRSRLLELSGDVYAFSCYVWNMRLVRFLAQEIAKHLPHSLVLLGGPQVDGHGAEYLHPHRENLLVSNGEGEPIFRKLLLAHQSGGELTSVPGLTLYRDAHLIDTPSSNPIEDINEIPSPFLTGMFEGVYTTTVFETNRGCPYACSFCYWGKGDDNSVRKFEDARLRDEIAWIAKNSICYIHLGDANWGMLKRDVELSREIVACKEKYGAPLLITFAAAKGKIERSSEIATIFHDAEIVSAQAIGVQSTTDTVLESIRRRQIKLEVLRETSVGLEQRGISTYAELIWPLPGETLDTFKTCLTSVCASGVTSIIIYPALLLHATPMEDQVEEFQVETVDTDDEVSELQLIVSTRDVTRAQNDDGIWLSFAVYCLFNARTLRKLGKYLNDLGMMTWAELFSSFGEFCRTQGGETTDYWREVVRTRTHAEQHALGRLIHLVLHERRHEFLELLGRFARTQAWWQDEKARVLFGVDLVNAPYVYSNTSFVPIPPALCPLEHLDVVACGARAVRVSVGEPWKALVGEFVFGDRRVCTGAFEVTYQHEQFPFMPAKPMRENFTYVYGMIHRASVITPHWRDIGAGA